MVHSYRFVLVDDTDERLKLAGGPWFLDVRNSSRRQFSQIGTPYKQAQHATNSSGTISFTYKGSDVVLAGTSDVRNVTNRRWSREEPDPDWKCYLDGTPYPSPRQLNPQGTNEGDGISLCDIRNVKEGTHTLTVEVKSRGRPFWVDHVRYLPSPKIVPFLKNVTVAIDRDDPAVELKGAWNPDSDNYWSNPILDLDFVGTKMKLYGRLFHNYRPVGAYILDGGPDVEFKVPYIDGYQSWELRRLIFESPPLVYGRHNIRITYEEGWPFDPHVFVENGEILKPSEPDDSEPPGQPTNGPPVGIPISSLPETETFPIPDTTSAPSNPPQTPGSSSGSALAIVDTVLRSFAFLAIGLLIATIFTRWRRRRRRRGISLPGGEPNLNTTPPPSPPPREEIALHPFITPETVNRDDNPSATVPRVSGTTTKQRLAVEAASSGPPMSSATRASPVSSSAPGGSSTPASSPHPLADVNSGVEVHMASGDPFQDALAATVLVDVDITDAVLPVYSEFV